MSGLRWPSALTGSGEGVRQVRSSRTLAGHSDNTATCGRGAPRGNRTPNPLAGSRDHRRATDSFCAGQRWFVEVLIMADARWRCIELRRKRRSKRRSIMPGRDVPDWCSASSRADQWVTPDAPSAPSSASVTDTPALAAIHRHVDAAGAKLTTANSRRSVPGRHGPVRSLRGPLRAGRRPPVHRRVGNAPPRRGHATATRRCCGPTTSRAGSSTAERPSRPRSPPRRHGRATACRPAPATPGSMRRTG